MKIDLYSAAEAAKVLVLLRDMKLGSGKTALKVFDNSDILGKKAMFLEEEIQKIFQSSGAVPRDLENNDLRMVVKNEDGTVDEEATVAFVNEIVEIRKTEIELDIEPFTTDEIEKFDLSPSEIGKIRFMITAKEDPKKEEDDEPIITIG